MKVSVVIPAHNEEENLVPLVEAIEKMRNSSGLELELIIVDDGSTDGTWRVAEGLGKRFNYIRLFRHKKRRGLSSALDTGFSSATGDIFVFYPADLQYHPEDIPRLIAKIEAGCDVVAGWRQGKYEKAFISSIYNRLARWVFGLKIHDLNSVKAFRREVYDALVMREDWHRYIIPFASAAGFTVDEVRVTLYPRRAGRSKYRSPWRAIVGFLDLLSVKFLISIMKKPMLLFGTSGLISIFLGFVVGFIALYYRFVLGRGYRPAIYLVILLFVVGLSLFTVGFLAEVLSIILQRLGGTHARTGTKNDREV